MPRFNLVVAGLLSVWLMGAGPLQAQQYVSVGTIVAAKQPVTKSVNFVGRVEAIERVSVRARVTGYLDQTFFKDGDKVKAGQQLFQIDPLPYQAAVQQAQGALLQARGAYANATVQRQRADDLLKTKTTPASTRDQRVADETNAQGAVISADAALKTAQLNLSFATVTSPVDGRIGRAALTKGNLISADTGPLALIVSQNPIYVTFPVSEREFLRLRREGNATNRDSLSVTLRFADGSLYDQTGKIDFVDVVVDRSTDTMLVRAQVANPKEFLVPDQFVRVAVAGDTPQEKIVIPQAALIADQEGTYVFVVADGKAAVKRLKVGEEVGTGVAVESGLAPGDLVIVTGTQTLRPGSPVAPSPLPSAAITPVKG